MLKVIIQKELKRVFSDRRLVFTTFVLPALSIFMIYSLMGSMINKKQDSLKTHVYSVYLQNAPEGFSEFLSTSQWKDIIDTTIFKGEDNKNVKKHIQEGKIDVLVVFEEGFKEKVNRYQEREATPQIRTYYNSSEDHSAYAKNRIILNALSTYEDILLGERLGGVHYVNVFDIDKDNKEKDLVEDKKAASKGLSQLVPMLIAIFLFAGAMGIGIDIIAGEKERGTMATMLITPVKREVIALGKIISLGIVALSSALSSFAGIILSLPFSASMISSGATVDIKAIEFTTLDLIQLLLTMLSLVSMYVCIICLISIFAKNVKEASSYMAPVYMLVMICAFMSMFSSEIELWQYFIPIYGNIAVIKGIFSFELTILQFGVSFITSVVVSAMLVKIITKMFNDEKVMLSS